MGEATIDPKVVEDAMLKAFSAHFPSVGTTNNPAVEFYSKFQRAADDHDHDFIKKYDEDLNTTLIFAGLFSAVTSAFIIDVQSDLKPDFEEMNNTLLKIVASAALGNTPTGVDAALPEWNGPDGTIVHVQAILYSSLSTSLLAAFVAMLGKQWLNRYASVERGSVIDRGRQRKHKMDGMMTWRFNLVMECLPFMLQIALLLLGYALSNYLFFINRVVSSVLIGFTTFGLLFYLLITSAATLSYNCPFQTPLSLTLRFLSRFDDEHRRYLKRFKKWFEHILNWMKQGQWRPRSGGLNVLGRFCGSNGNNRGTSSGNSSGEHIELHVTTQPPPIFNKEIMWDWDGYVVDSDCIAWAFGMPMDMDLTMATARFISEITWHAGTRAIPLERLYDTLLKCFDHSTGSPVLKPALRDHAYFSAKALTHVAIQHKCFGGESNSAALESILSRHQIMGDKHYEGDPDLEATLGIIDRIFGGGDFKPLCWENFRFTIPHHTWMGHVLLYRAWDALGKGGPLPDDTKQFILRSLRLDPPPSGAVVADCLFVIGLVLGIELHIDDLLVADKSHEVRPQIDRIYEKLTATFGNPSPTTEEIDRALQSTELIAPLSSNGVPAKSYALFRVIMQTPVSPAFPQEKKWEASRLTMRNAFGWGRRAYVEDPHDILTFLNHHLDLAIRDGHNQDEPIGDAMEAFSYALKPAAIGAFKRFDPEPSFDRGICHMFQNNKPFRLRRAALYFLPLIGDRWFNAPYPIMEPDQMKSLCVGWGWASSIDRITHTYDVKRAALAVLLGMINSPHWRPHIVAEKWKLLEYAISVPDDSQPKFWCVPYDPQPLRRCLDNPELIEAIRNVESPDAMGLWLKILWVKYKELIPQVREQLEVVTKEFAQGSRKTDLDGCLSVMDSELRKAEDAVTQYGSLSTDPAAVTLRTKIYDLRQARVVLVALKGG